MSDRAVAGILLLATMILGMILGALLHNIGAERQAEAVHKKTTECYASMECPAGTRPFYFKNDGCSCVATQAR